MIPILVRSTTAARVADTPPAAKLTTAIRILETLCYLSEYLVGHTLHLLYDNPTGRIETVQMHPP